MNHFWPRRPSPEGFSIEKLAKSYQQKISKNTFQKNENSYLEKEPLRNKINLIERLKVKASLNTISIEHWANRDFIEYKHVA